MEGNTFYQWSPAGVMNNLPPTLPDVADPSDAQALNHIPGTQYSLQPFNDHHIVTGNTYTPAGTRNWDYTHSDPQLGSAYPPDYTPNSLEWGYHNYQPTQDYLLNPAWNIMGDNDLQYIPDPQWEILLGDDAAQFIPEPQPEILLGDDAAQFTSVNFQHTHSPATTDGITVVPVSSYSQTLSQSRQQDIGSVVGDHINVDAMEYMYDPTDPTDPTASLLRRQFDLAAEPLLTTGLPHDDLLLSPKDMSTGDTSRPEFIDKSSMLKSVSYGDESYDNSKGSFPKAGAESNDEEITSRGRCVRCQAMEVKVCPHPIAAYYH
jgi:hypothetical protein